MFAFKDGVAYPWSAGVSNMILYPEAANQTLYARRATRGDSGNYTCRLSNETHVEAHTVKLTILEKPTDAPRTMFISKDQWVEEGAELRLYCEALIGRSLLADARSDLRWRKVFPNNTEGDLLPTQTEIKTTRNDVVSKNYVTVHYIHDTTWCGSGSVPWRALALGAAAGALALLSAAALHRRCTPRLLLAARHARARAQPTARRARVLEKEFDVLVCWTAVDGELVRGALLPTLSLKYKYRVHAVPLSTQPDTWYSELVGEASRCRSLDLPKLKREAKEGGESLVSTLRGTRLVAWRHVHERAFWTALRLALPLPPAPARDTKPNPAETEENKYSRSGSLTALV
ncbi:hypothetical protein HW555_011255 [Spodoptera exigua]|uniref:Ig-like domain-containing protein n=1 Tax=Spodoptera exigua TaxID=7107 RepID=A0A835G809_SPOEX|nr:hypothetical protein HW555_011255 [Spodoptera exigua]